MLLSTEQREYQHPHLHRLCFEAKSRCDELLRSRWVVQVRGPVILDQEVVRGVEVCFWHEYAIAQRSRGRVTRRAEHVIVQLSQFLV